MLGAQKKTLLRVVIHANYIYGNLVVSLNLSRRYKVTLY